MIKLLKRVLKEIFLKVVIGKKVDYIQEKKKIITEDLVQECVS